MTWLNECTPTVTLDRPMDRVYNKGTGSNAIAHNLNALPLSLTLIMKSKYKARLIAAASNEWPDGFPNSRLQLNLPTTMLGSYQLGLPYSSSIFQMQLMTMYKDRIRV